MAKVKRKNMSPNRSSSRWRAFKNKLGVPFQVWKLCQVGAQRPANRSEESARQASCKPPDEGKWMKMTCVECAVWAEGPQGEPTVSRVKAKLPDDSQGVPPKQRAEYGVKALRNYAETWVVTLGDVGCR
jgi:hypothetical protein